MKIKIRKAAVKDLKRIDEIYVEGSIDEGKYQKFDSIKKIKEELKRYKYNRRRGFKEGIIDKQHYWIVAEQDGIIIGFGQAWIKNNKIGITESVYVDKKYRRAGVGKKIMKELIKWIKNKNLKKIESSAFLDNKPSIKLHQRLGFKPFILKMRLN